MWCIQFKAFLWKICLQHLRSPVLTILELLLPSFFILLLSLGYWYSQTKEFGGTDQINWSNVNASYLLFDAFCQNATHPRPFGETLPLQSCTGPEMEPVCLPFVRQGALCVRNKKSLHDIMAYTSQSAASIVVPTLDAYLALSAVVTYERKKKDAVFFYRTGRMSMSHYGHLLIVVTGDNTSIGTEFAKFCTEVSALCGEVVYTKRIFTSMNDAQKFAKERTDEVWAIVELFSPSFPSTEKKKGDIKEANIFTISMNYTATPSTFNPKTSFSSHSGAREQSLYVSSGFLTLQNYVQQFYLRRRLKNITELTPSGVKPSDIFEYAGFNGLSLKSMPFLPYKQNDFYTRWSYFVPLVSVLTAVYPIVRLVVQIVEEKFFRIRESMYIMGLRWSCMAFGWYVSALIKNFIVTLLVTAIMKASYFGLVRCGILLVLHFSFMHQNTVLALFLSTVFTNPRIAGVVAAMCVFVCSLPYYFFPEGTSVARLVALSFAPCVAYTKSFKTLLMYTSFDRSFSWKDIFYGEFSVALAIGLMWASSCIMMILGMYLDHVFPSSIGRRRHPFFFLSCLRGLCCCCRRPKETEVKKSPLTENKLSADGAPTNALGSLPEARLGSFDKSRGLYAAVFRNLCKIYETGGIIGWFYYFLTGLRRDGDRCSALRDVSFELEFGKVNVLLGPNGSGKSTLMGVATGMVEPTSGEVHICGHDATAYLGKCRKHIGYCPQSDIVWGNLTVEEHLFFYARMKKVANGRWDVKEQVDDVITKMHLDGKRKTLASHLSAGQQRRLSVGIALVGDPDVLFLDEPTSGMDIKGRKAVYSALKQDNGKRAVLISTHLLDDADYVGDRILLLHNGALRCAGPSVFLKSKVGVGYVLTCVVDTCSSEMEESMLISNLTEFVRTRSCTGHLNATAKSEENKSEEPQALLSRCKLLGVDRRGREISFRFPFEFFSTTGSDIIQQLEENREKLCLRSIGLSFATLQDVIDFVTESRKQDYTQPTSTSLMEKLFDNSDNNNRNNDGGAEIEQGISIEMKDHSVSGATFVNLASSKDANLRRTGSVFDSSTCRDRKMGSFTKHFSVLFMKRVHCAKRDLRFVIYQIILPVFFLFVAFLTDYVDPPAQPAILLDASLYPGYNKQPYKTVVWTTASGLPDVFHVSGRDMSTAFGPYYTPVHVPCESNNCVDSLFNAMRSNLMNYTSDIIFALSLTSQHWGTASIVPTSILMYNSSAYHSTPQAINALYNVINHQLFGESITVTARNKPMEMGSFEKKPADIFCRLLFGILVMLPFTLIPSHLISYILREKESGSRHLQWLAGANTCAFWLSCMLFDFCCYLMTQLLAMLLFLLFKRTEFIGSKEAVGATLAHFSMFGLSALALNYVLTFFISSRNVAQSVLLTTNFVIGFLWVLGEQILGGIALFENFVTYTGYFLRAFPAVSFCEGVFVLVGIETMHLAHPELMRREFFSMLRFEKGILSGGIGTGLIYMFCTFLGSLLLLIIFESAQMHRFARVFRRLFFCRSSGKVVDKGGKNSDISFSTLSDFDNGGADKSVEREEKEVCARATGRAEDYITLQHITKKHSAADRPSVDDVSFGVHKGEIMALLGLNGAGKTTVISILASIATPTSGSVYINHLPLFDLASRTCVGYCPQKDALIEHLSPYEHLCLYATLRGACHVCARKEALHLLSVLGLGAQRDLPAYSLSGGNKRRLSFAIALVGGTTSILLDEPTASMDYVARRQTYAVIKPLTAQRSVILTTHLVDEAEALANRVAFISKGKLRCIGAPLELKACFAGILVYVVSVVFAGKGTADCVLGSDVANRLCECFSTVNEREVEKSCTLESIVGRTVTLLVKGSLSHICTVAAALREGKMEGLPPVAQVYATQQTLEHALLRL